MNDSVKVTIIHKTLSEIHQEGIEASKKAVDDFLKDWNQKTGGNEYNEPTYCGFAHVALPDIKLSTKIGKEFAKIGLDTAKSVLEYDLKDLVSRTDLEEETIQDVINILKEEFEE